MANYIQTLQKEVETLASGANAAEDAITDFRKHLNSDKFRSGDALDGYINVADVHRWLETIRTALNNA